jgi:hypothetical protein
MMPERSSIQPPNAPLHIRIGPAGWSYPDWEGPVYPKPKPRGFDPLVYLAQSFDTIEINSTLKSGNTRIASLGSRAKPRRANASNRLILRL